MTHTLQKAIFICLTIALLTTIIGYKKQKNTETTNEASSAISVENAQKAEETPKKCEVAPEDVKSKIEVI